MDNPFDLRGPEFLLFYLILGIAVNQLLRFLIRVSEKQDTPLHWESTDPYKIAYLRAGVNEALRVALFSLIDRGLIKATDDKVRATRNAAGLVKRPIEKELVVLFDSPREVKYMYDSAAASSAGSEYKDQLSREGLISDSRIVTRRAPFALSAVGLLAWVSVTKINLAIQRGHHNIGLLIILTFFFVIWAVATWGKRRTGSGDAIIDRLERNFTSLKKNAVRIRPGGMTTDAAFLVAVFGLTALPNDYFPYVKQLFPQASSAIGGTSYTGGCGSAGCGSSGCGGGGCGGGGCGGCGGG